MQNLQRNGNSLLSVLHQPFGQVRAVFLYPKIPFVLILHFEIREHLQWHRANLHDHRELIQPIHAVQRVLQQLHDRHRIVSNVEWFQSIAPLREQYSQVLYDRQHQQILPL